MQFLFGRSDLMTDLNFKNFVNVVSVENDIPINIIV